MTIQLESVQLPKSMIWSDEHLSQSVAQSRKRTLGGKQVVLYAGVTAGISITLESGPDTAWLTKTQVEAIKALADAPGAIYALTLRGQNYQAMFRHDDPPAFEASPLFPLANPASGDYYIGRIKLVTI